MDHCKNVYNAVLNKCAKCFLFYEEYPLKHIDMSFVLQYYITNKVKFSIPLWILDSSKYETLEEFLSMFKNIEMIYCIAFRRSIKFLYLYMKYIRKTDTFDALATLLYEEHNYCEKFRIFYTSFCSFIPYKDIIIFLFSDICFNDKNKIIYVEDGPYIKFAMRESYYTKKRSRKIFKMRIFRRRLLRFMDILYELNCVY